MELPNIGKPGSILSILIPGTFLLFNLLLFIYIISPELDLKNNEILFLLEESKSLIFVIFLLVACFGYLLGVVLRLFSCETPDQISIFFLNFIHDFKNLFRRKKRTKKTWRTTFFPYVKWIGETCKHKYSDNVNKFYQQIWEKRRHKDGKEDGKDILNTEFFNLCKVLLISIKPDLAAECYAAEALNRYISSMFYALLISFSLIVLCILDLFFRLGDFSILLLFLATIYALVEIVIVSRYRFIRLKEVDTVFTATYAVKDEIINLLAK